MGISGLKKLAKKATEVVLDVKAIALNDRRNVYAILFLRSSFVIIVVSIVALYLQASMKTNISSAAMPSTTKMTNIWS